MVEQGFRLVDAIGECEIDTARRELRVLGSAVPIGGRAFEVIEVLAQSAGELVTKDKLMGRIWPGAIVTENTLQVHALAIRKALGPYRSLLKTVSGRGYRLLGDWAVRPHGAAKPPVGLRRMQVDGESPVTNFPATVTRLVGRTAAVAKLRDLVSAYRAVTLTGPGGIGKTSLALKVARGIVGDFADGGWLVELASLADPALVPAAVVRSLALKLDGQEFSAEAIARAIGNHHILIVLDNCEHVIGAAASLAETLLRSCPHTTVLATSRETLRIEGEFVYRVAPLEVPSPHEEASGDILEHSAVQLFITRMQSLGEDYRADSSHLPMVGAMCRRLDGIPLAIEFAAARAATLGIQHVARSLDDRFALLVATRRTASPRHQTLRATLDWSYELLTEPERVILRRLAVLAGPFGFQAATAVAADPETELAPVVESLSSLVAKSLVTTEGDGAVARYRLLDTTRAYASEKLDESGEREPLGRRHAEYYRDVFERAETEALVRPTSEWLADYTPEIDNLRSALDWAFSPHGGDVSVGIALTAAAVPLWIYLSLVEECRRRVEQALTALVLSANSDARLEMKLQAALGASLGRVGGNVTEMESAWTRTLDLAKGTGNVDYELRALFGLWMIRDRGSLALAEQFAAGAKTPADRLISDQMIGHSYFIQGNQNAARHHLEHAIANHGLAAGVGSWIVRFQIDHDPMCSLARVLWLQGLPEQAMCMAERLVEREKAQDHANSLCASLALGTCPIALWTGNLHLAEQYIEVLHETSKRYGLTLWYALARAHRGVLLIKRGNLQAGLPQLRAAFEECWVVPTGYRVLIFIAELPEALGVAGQTSEGLVTVEKALARAERTAEGWIFAELLRVKGELLLQQAMRAPEAEECFQYAGKIAHEHGALAWELRAATSLARLWYGQNRRGEALSLLQPVYDRFTEGFGTADLKAAKALLDTLL
jgi:predicted ATPase/DNA-binding winged helix-turn-helix (wHTH) protein